MLKNVPLTDGHFLQNDNIFTILKHIYFSTVVYFCILYRERILFRLGTLSLLIKLIQKLIVFGKLKDNIIYFFCMS